MVEAISNTPVTSESFPLQETSNSSFIPPGIGSIGDSIDAKEPLTGFSYAKVAIVSIAAIMFFSIVAFFANLLYKDEAKQADLDAEIAYHRNKLKEAKEGKAPSEL